VQTILGTTRHPTATDNHVYDDKFTLTQILVNTSVAALMDVFEALGLTSEQASTLNGWKEHSVTLRFGAQERCEFIKEEIVELEPMQEKVVETAQGSICGVGSGSRTTTTATLVRKVKVHHW